MWLPCPVSWARFFFLLLLLSVRSFITIFRCWRLSLPAARLFSSFFRRSRGKLIAQRAPRERERESNDGWTYTLAIAYIYYIYLYISTTFFFFRATPTRLGSKRGKKTRNKKKRSLHSHLFYDRVNKFFSVLVPYTDIFPPPNRTLRALRIFFFFPKWLLHKTRGGKKK